MIVEPMAIAGKCLKEELSFRAHANLFFGAWCVESEILHYGSGSHRFYQGPETGKLIYVDRRLGPRL